MKFVLAMVNVNNNFNVIPWYSSLEQQNHRKWYAFDKQWPLIMPNTRFLPFQFVLETTPANISAITVYSEDKSITRNLGIAPIAVPNAEKGYCVVMLHPEICDFTAALPEGRYYATLTIDGETLYSEVFTVVGNISSYLKLTYWNTDTLYYKNGEINYANDFRYEMYLDTTIGKPEYEFSEELTTRLGYKFLESQISNKLYKFVFLGPEFICDAMRLIRLSDYIKLESGRDSYNAISFSYEPSWETQGDLASIEVSFETDTIIQKLPSFNRNQRENFYNALLSSASEPLLFDEGVVAQYYTAFNDAITGKLTRQLAEANVEEITEATMIPIDQGLGAAQRISLLALFERYGGSGNSGRYVNLDTAQEVGGIKTFIDKIIFKKDINVYGNAIIGGEVVAIAGEGTPVGVTDYSALTGKPSINGKELISGENSLTELGIQPAGDYATEGSVDAKLGNYATKTFVSNNYAGKSALNNHIADSVKHITDIERTAWNAKWNYNEATIKGIKVNNAGHADSADNATSAGSADKLTNSRKIFGLPFDGTKDVNGGITANGDSVINGNLNVKKDGIFGGEVVAIAGDAEPARVTNYAQLQGKPSINGKELASGDNTLDALGIQPKGDYTTASQLATTLDNYATKVFVSNNYATKAAVYAIQALIPTTATADNQLADKDFVNSSIATATAEFRGSFTSLDELKDTSGNLNDYAFYLHKDSVGNSIVDRYKWTTAGWLYEYTLNNSSFTAEQWAALNSAITATLVNSYNSHLNNSTIHITANERTAWNNKWDYNEDTIKGIKVNAAVLSDSATKLATARKIWGRYFDGSDDVSGDLEYVGNITASGKATIQGDIISGGEVVAIAGEGTPAGVTDYSALTGKPSINGVTLVSGNNTLAALGIQAAGDYATNSGVTTLLADYATKTFVANNYVGKSAFNNHTADTDIHITAAERNAWNAKWDYNEATIKAVKVTSASSADSVAWSGISDKPTTFTPSAHTHTASEISGLPTALSAFNNDVGYITGITKSMVEAVLTGDITSHTHNYAGSYTAGGAAISSQSIAYTNAINVNYGDRTYFQQTHDVPTWPHTGWFNSIKMLHHNSKGYFTEIVTSFTGEDGMWRRSFRAGTQYGWYKMLDSGNFNTYAPTLTGTGASGTWGINISGNAATATNADLLDEYHISDIGPYIFGSTAARYLDKSIDLNDATVNSHGGWWSSYDNTGYANAPTNNFGLLVARINTGYTAQLILQYGGSLMYRSQYYASSGISWTSWRTIAFTDSNVASATKLATARTIWGQSFDGTSDVNGDINITDGVIRINSKALIYVRSGISILGNYTQNTFLRGNVIEFQCGSSAETAMTILSSGNVLIGTTTGNGYKLQVIGSERVYGDLIVDGEVSALVA